LANERGEDEYESISGLSEPTRVLLDTLLGRAQFERAGRQWIDRKRRDAVVKLAELPDKEKKSVAAYLAKRLPGEDYIGRMWTVSALAEINSPDTVDDVAARLDPKVEENAWVRYWAAVGLANMVKISKDLKDRLAKAAKDDQPLVEAVSKRLLIENGFDEQGEYIKRLLEMMKSRNYSERWAACRALRHESGHKPFQENIEKKFVPILVERLHDQYESIDVRHEALMGLGNMRHESKKAIKELRTALEETSNDWLRRSCVDSLAKIGKSETKDALLFALQDVDAEIRLRAADALKGALEGATGAVKFVVDELLRQDQPTSEYLQNVFDALRRISSEESAKVLSEKLLDQDPNVSKRARDALTGLGGEEAVRILQVKRTEALDKYTALLKTADDQIMEQFNRMMVRAMSAFSLTMWMNGIIFGIGVVVLVASLYVAMSAGFETFERLVGVGTASGSLITLLGIFYKDPLRNIHRSVTNLVRVYVVFLGYVRQINQIDATFKQMFLAPAGFGVVQMKETVEQIQGSVNKTMEEVKAWFPKTEPQPST